jgi:hypothetical protein
MDDAPDDILKLIFESYIHRIYSSSANLTSYRQSPLAPPHDYEQFWTRVSTVVDSFDKIIYLIGKPENDDQVGDTNEASGITPLFAYYFKHSIPSNRSRGLLLDISIR